MEYFSARVRMEVNCTSLTTDSPQTQISEYKYTTELEEGLTAATGPLAFWSQRRSSYSFISDLPQDLVAALASQAVIERIFSLCGILTQGRRNGMCKSLEMCACVKLNSKILADI